MIRIITGKFKGKQLQVPLGTKPITDRIKTSIFDLLGEFTVPGFTALDLFSGSGNFGLEAISRGAGSAVMVDNGIQQYSIISLNIKRVGAEKEAKLLKQDVFQYLKQEQRSFDVIMLDPPFPFSCNAKSELLADSLKLLNTDGVLIFRFPAGDNYRLEATLGDEYDEVYRHKYGVSIVAFYCKKN